MKSKPSIKYKKASIPKLIKNITKHLLSKVKSDPSINRIIRIIAGKKFNTLAIKYNLENVIISKLTPIKKERTYRKVPKMPNLSNKSVRPLA
ncbi:hypothetical protein AZZ78_001290, partial [Klebsiella pneumoniae]